MLHAVVGAVAISTCWGQLKFPQFSNPIYSALNYTGSRVLETNYTANPFVDLVWTQTAAVDSDDNVFMAHADRNAIVSIPASSSYWDYPGEGTLYAGKSCRAGHSDGSAQSALFNGPSGIGIFENEDNVKFIIVADTNNHVIRRINTDTDQVVTIAGIPGQAGLRDGDGRKALFKLPTSIGIDTDLGTVYVLDNMSVIRKIEITDTDDSFTVSVSSLVEGACRAISESTTYETIVSRIVRCQYEWLVNDPGSTQEVDEWVWPTFCLGHASTCATRYDEL